MMTNTQHTQWQHDARFYVKGLIWALILTLIPFALIHWQLLARQYVLISIGVFAIAQILVHLRFFLHLDLKRKREDLLLLLFSALLLFIMAAGTIWIMFSLAQRMM